MEQQTYVLEVQKLHLVIQCHTGAFQKVPHGGPQDTSLVLFFNAQRLAGSTVSTLFSCPGFTLEKVCIGVMHCVDLGVTQEVLGNIFSEYLEKGGLTGRSQKIRCETLWANTQYMVQTCQAQEPDPDFDCDQV